MRTFMTKAIIIILLAVAAMPCLAQQNDMVSFSYDANGNRILRQIELGGEGKGAKGDEISSYFDSFESMSVKLYPNPTEGKFSIEIDGTGESGLLHATLSTTTGEVISEKVISGQKTDFDLTQKPVGVYLLRLSMKGESHVWKVIRK